MELGKFGIPAKHHEAIALIYARDVQPSDNSAVLHHLSMAAHYYFSDNRTAARNKVNNPPNEAREINTDV